MQSIEVRLICMIEVMNNIITQAYKQLAQKGGLHVITKIIHG
jgi:hypothetical protein